MDTEKMLGLGENNNIIDKIKHNIPINVLSLFDGISCGQLALKRADIKVNKYYSSEIDRNAISITQYHYPNTIQLGDINNWKQWEINNKLNFKTIDLLIGGSPCQSLSNCGKREGFEGISNLFYRYVEILNHIKTLNPNIRFLLENVKMKTEWKNIITRELNEYPVEINSSLLSAQSRPRLYWANWLIRKPKDKHILFKDIIEDDGWVKTDKSHCITKCYNHNVGKEEYMERREKIGGFCSYVWLNPNNQTYKLLAEKDIEYEKLYSIECNRSKQFGIGINENKAYCLTKRMLTGLTYKGKVRLLTPLECERLQTLPENYTKYGINKETNQIEEIRKTKRYETIGNGWTVDVIVHIFEEMVEDKKVLRLF